MNIARPGPQLALAKVLGDVFGVWEHGMLV